VFGACLAFAVSSHLVAQFRISLRTAAVYI